MAGFVWKQQTQSSQIHTFLRVFRNISLVSHTVLIE